MKISEMRGHSSEELREKMGTWRREVFDLRFKSVTEPIQNPSELNEKRKDIARAMTILRSRELGTETEPKMGEVGAQAVKEPKQKERKHPKKITRAIRRDDTVEVLGGSHAGKQGRVLRVLREDQKVVVEGVNYIWKHLAKTQQNPQGGRLQKEAPLPISKVKIVQTADAASE